jgi:hypothetical protein
MDIREKADSIGMKIAQILKTPNREKREEEWKGVQSEWRELMEEIIRTTSLAETKNNSVKPK